MVFWTVVPCSVVVGYQCFVGPCCPIFMVEMCGEWKVAIDIGRV